MNKRLLASALILWGFMLGACLGQTPIRFWECEVGEGEFVVSLFNIGSVSKHTYILDGVVRVFETTVSTKSSVIARFYFLEPVKNTPLGAGHQTIDRAQKLIEKGIKSAGAKDVLTQVVKNYPTSTHAHTVEFRLTRKEDVNKIYDSVKNAWQKGVGSHLSIKPD